MHIANMNFTKQDILNVFAIVISTIIYACGFNVFVRSGNLFPGGFAGLSRLISMVLSDALHISISFSVIYFVLNALVTLRVLKKTGHKFILYSVLWFLTSLNEIF